MHPVLVPTHLCILPTPLIAARFYFQSYLFPKLCRSAIYCHRYLQHLSKRPITLRKDINHGQSSAPSARCACFSAARYARWCWPNGCTPGTGWESCNPAKADYRYARDNPERRPHRFFCQRSTAIAQKQCQRTNSRESTSSPPCKERRSPPKHTTWVPNHQQLQTSPRPRPVDQARHEEEATTR